MFVTDAKECKLRTCEHVFVNPLAFERVTKHTSAVAKTEHIKM